MARYISSFVQRRLLRFILSKADWIDTEAYDLGSLELSWGIWELKDVPLKIEKLRERLHLPPELDLNSARVHLIKFILPADLLSSNITVEVSDVEVQATLREIAKDDEHAKHPSSTPTRASADRSKRVHPSIYDPGGTKGLGGLEGLIPRSADIAQSFLEAEPEDEIQELESAVASQSQDLRHSAAYGSESGELGVGAATTLPSFVTDLVKGVFDKFQLRLQRIAVKLVLDITPKSGATLEEGLPKDIIQFLLQVEEVKLDAVDPSIAPDDPLHAKRQLSLSGARMCLLGEPEGSFRTRTASGNSSPVLQSRSSAFRSTGSSDVRSADSNASGSPNISRVASWTPSMGRSQDTDSSIVSTRENEGLDASEFHVQGDRYYGSSATSRETPEVSDGTNRSDPPVLFSSQQSSDNVDDGSSGSSGEAYASVLAERGKMRRQSEASRSSMFDSQAFGQGQEGDPEDLTESKLFSHDDAESMNMSAMSGSPTMIGRAMPMPGAWSTYESPNRRLQGIATTASAGKDALPSSENGRDFSQDRHSALPTITENIPTTGSPAPESLPEQTATTTHQVQADKSQAAPSSERHMLFLGTTVLREVVRIERMTCWLPSFFEPSSPADPSIQRTSPAMSNVNQSIRFSSSTDDPHPDFSFTSAAASMHQSSTDAKALEIDGNGIAIEVSAVHIDFDIGLIKILLALSQAVNLGRGESEKPSSTRENQSLPQVKFNMAQLSINFLDQLPGQVVTSHAVPWSPGETSPSLESDLLLSLSVTELICVNLPNTKANESRISIAGCTLSHTTGTILAFSDRDGRVTATSQNGQTSCASAVVTMSDQLIHADIKTTPVVLRLDLRALEEILSKAGGLSSLLELGNSIASISTVKAVPSKPPTPKRARGVRFEHDPPTKPQSNGRTTKVNIRLASVALSLIGSEHDLMISTSSVKMVQRAEGLGLQIDRAELAGPLTRGREQQAPLRVSLSNIRLEYLETPKEADIDRLLRLITPSKDKYDEADDIMLDTLLRQRSKGAVLRLTLGNANVSLSNVEEMRHFIGLSADLSRLSGVTKYLPEDDRPGILTLLLIKETNLNAAVNDKIGVLDARLQLLEVGYINLPSLTAAQITTITLKRNSAEDLIIPAVQEQQLQHPMFMCRFIAGEMEPTLRIKLFNILLEYHVPTLVDFLGLGEEVTEEDIALGIAASFADLRDIDMSGKNPSQSSPVSVGSDGAEPLLKGIRVDVGMRDLVLGLNPEDADSKGLICLTDANLFVETPKGKDLTVKLAIKKASILLVDDQATLENPISVSASGVQSARAFTHFKTAGYVAVGDISSASAKLNLLHNGITGASSIDVELRDDLFILETCADSTQTLSALLDGLKPPAPVSKVAKYRTEIIPIQDMLSSFSGDAFVSDQGPEKGLRTDSHGASNLSGEDEEGNEELEFVSEFYEPPIEESRESLVHSSGSIGLDFPLMGQSETLQEDAIPGEASPEPEPSPEEMVASALNFQEDYFARNSVVGGTAHNWRGDNNYGHSREHKYQDFPVKVKVRDVHFIWNLFDGYDWQRTRDRISQAVQEIEVKAASRRGRPSSHAPEAEDEEDSVIGDFLFNSIYIGIPAHRDPHELAADINRGIDDDVSETGSYATSTTATASPSRQHQSSRSRSKRLKLGRSKHHKMTFELSGVSADLLVFPPESGETQSSVDVRVKDLVIFDHVPTSTWRRFATYMRDAGERETGTSMIHIEVLNVKPVPDLAATEMILKVSVLPLRLHVDQDALDFMSRFFEFKDDTSPARPPTSNPPFIQRIEVNPVRVRLDFKPKRVDYAGLRSGRTTEFMNFFILDQADMVLRRVILYGVSGFDRLGLMLNSIWMPDVKRNQLPGVLAGLAPIRSLVNVGSGVKDLVVLPVREYQKDGRLVRSIQKGAVAFAKTTTSELVKLGAKLALGTQTVLQNTETMLGSSGDPASRTSGKWEDIEAEDEESQKQISLYADQPIGVIQGLRGAYASLERDLLLARDAIVAVPGEVMESSNAKGAARAVLQKAPTIILRPAIGATKAVGQTLLGAGNTLDRENYRRAEEKYKRH